MIPNTLTIAGTDPSGGAGIQADLKTFSALGTYGMSVVTALVAQNTEGVRAIQDVPVSFIREQIDAVFEDVRVDTVKIGMLSTPDVIEVVADGLRRHGAAVVVLDPVMVAKSGDRLLQAEAVQALREVLVPMATVITPNLPEAGDLLGLAAPADATEMLACAARLRALGPHAVMLKGGHLDGEQSIDVVDDGASEPLILSSPRIATRNTHGTGCTLSAAIAAYLAHRVTLREAAERAKHYLSGALAAADQLQVGHGHGPVHHFHRLWQGSER